MKRWLPVLLSLLSLGTILCLAQTDQVTIKEDFQPSSLNQPGQDYPQVNSQGYARFRIVAPQAQSVTVNLGGPGGTPLKKSGDGVWIGTTAVPLDEGFHYYHLSVDGGTFNDPGALNFYGSIRWKAGSKSCTRSGILCAQGRSSRPRSANLISFEEYRHLPQSIRLHASRLRKEPDQALSGAVPAAWLGRR